MKVMSEKEHSKAYRDRIRGQGFKQKMVWVHDSELAKFEAFKASLLEPRKSNNAD